MGESNKSLHQILIEQLQANVDVVSRYQFHRSQIALGKQSTPPELSPALKQFSDVFYPKNPEQPSKQRPELKVLDRNLKNIGNALGEMLGHEKNLDKSPLKSIINLSEQYISSNDQPRFETVLKACFKGIEKLSREYGASIAITTPGKDFYTTAPENMTNFLKTVYLDVIDVKYTGLDTSKFRPAVPADNGLATTAAKGITQVTPDLHPKIEALKQRIAASANTPAAPAPEKKVLAPVFAK